MSIHHTKKVAASYSCETVWRVYTYYTVLLSYARQEFLRLLIVSAVCRVNVPGS